MSKKNEQISAGMSVVLSKNTYFFVKRYEKQFEIFFSTESSRNKWVKSNYAQISFCYIDRKCFKMNIENSIFRIFRKLQTAIIPKVIELEQKNLTHVINSSQATIVPNFIQIRERRL